jgi:hypothetical protein
MRNICDVIDQIIKVVPSTEKGLLNDLDYVKQKSMYKAPEAMYECWLELQFILTTNLPSIPIQEWHFEIVSIFSTRPVKEIKKFYKKQG